MDIVERYFPKHVQKQIERKRIFDIANSKRKKLNSLELKTMPWNQKLKWDLVKVWDAICGAKKIVDSRKPEWKRIGGRILNILESIILIGGVFAVKKLPIKF